MKNLLRHEQRFTRALDHLCRHYQCDSDLHRLAEEAHLSPWHWHRLYHQLMGETPHATQRWMRLHRAAWLLGNSDKSIADIARECGYGGNAQSFARIFRGLYGLTPHQYRQQNRPVSYPVEIVTLPDIALIALEHRGDYQRLGDSYAKLEAILRLRGQMPDAPRIFSLQYCDPATTSEEELRACIAVAGKPRRIEPPLIREHIRGGRYAVLRHCGPAAEIDHAYHWLEEIWLPQSGFTMRDDRPSINEYLTYARDTSPREQRSDLHIPLMD
ncbi:MAG: GyrI-like domain-containing protein [Cardiobacteriaceae bacterium]|nr:GyrI-like domain-containing protein [Cardiobacteriaceae bacterium]